MIWKKPVPGFDPGRDRILGKDPAQAKPINAPVMNA
jgi:hypothetical protein